MKKIAFKTLGCRLNQFETDSIVSQFHHGDYEIVDFSEVADVYVVNTCTVTKQGDSRSRQAVNFANRKNPDSLMVVTGCMVNNHMDNSQNLQDVTYFVKNEQKSSIFHIVESHLGGEMIIPSDLKPDTFNYSPADKTMHTRSMIKIQDGCDNFCTFCIVPKVRGRAVSRPPHDIMENIRKVLDFGFKEIILTGVNIGRYDSQDWNFEKLLESIVEISGDFRVRISSIEPDGYGDRFIELLQHPKVTPHLHLCLQSGSDRILLQMKRMYTSSEYRNIIDKIKREIPDFNFTTDIMVGFPGETEKDFQQTVSMVEEIGFSHVHTFKYSIRNGTRAARMEDQIRGNVKSDRSEIIRKLAEENKLTYRRTFIGKDQRVLIEKINRKGIAKGYGQHYIPVEFPANSYSRNDFAEVQIKEINRGKEPVLVGVV
ncbi:MAG: tRNA (N(6)-L-threonylcarbamoyladenosine(37)-C(2))-methylthiotransferase MtaB [Bacteroidetes bacterium]|nr:tRNA (N(6)-L-threonylcarbamoyladenosine(37)-C(2))-methylthiotransferase MtaB [Bacteroidota bacterium]